MAGRKCKIVRGTVFFYAGDPLQSLYIVHSGTLKTVTASYEGDPKVTGFYLPGDILGLEAIVYRQHLVDAIALEDCEVCVVPIDGLERMAGAVPALQGELFRAISGAISRDHGLVLLLGSMNAEERVASLLLSLSERYQHLGYSRDDLLLHMTREDMASYLGLTNETVCRVLSRLQRKGMLNVHQRHIELTDVRRLAETSIWQAGESDSEADPAR
jgi:CRP/FNR family transcriptional regulator